MKSSDLFGRSNVLFWLAVALALTARFVLAWSFAGNSDQESYEIVRNLVLHDQNVYAYTYRYNYSPVWFLTLDFLGNLTYALGVPFHFAVRSFLTLVDAATAYLLFRLATSIGISPRRAVLCFLLNPVTLLITGYHGQFDNFALVFLLLGLWFQLRATRLTNRDRGLAGASLAAAILVKQIVFFAPLWSLRKAFPRPGIRFLIFLLTTLPFFLSFLPYLPEGAQGIKLNVFGYNPVRGTYGITSLFFPYWTTYEITQGLKLLIAALLIVGGCFLIPRRDSPANYIRSALLAILIFLVFTPGYGTQYLVLPVALGALCRSPLFWLYTLAAGLHVAASPQNVHIAAIAFMGGSFGANCVWVSTILWLIYEARHFRFALHPLSEPVPAQETNA